MKKSLFEKNEILIGVLSDIHLYNKADKLLKALPILKDADVILIAGDMVDTAERYQYGTLIKLLDEILPDKSIFCVSGNHDNPKKDDGNFREFEKAVLLRSPDEYVTFDESGAFRACINGFIDLYGLNPVYNMKKFSFPQRAQQLHFLEQSLENSGAKVNIIMCHPPLISHNPQRNADETPYFSFEQDARLQGIVDSLSNVIFISGHTHVAPDIDFDDEKRNIYLNNGSVCPTTVKGREEKPQQGNVSLIKITDSYIEISVIGIYSKTELLRKRYDYNL